MATDHHDASAATETVYKHRFCSCVRAIQRHDDSQAMHRHFMFIEGLTVSRRAAVEPSKLPLIVRTCVHELTAADVAHWARRQREQWMTLADAAGDNFERNRIELQRCGILATKLWPDADVGFNAGRAHQAILEEFGLNLQMGAALDRDPPSVGSIDSWDVVEQLGGALFNQVSAMVFPNPLVPGLEQANALIDLMDADSASSPVNAGSVASVLVFFYGITGLLAAGADRKLIAYWAYRFSARDRSVRTMCISLAEVLRNDMRYAQRLEWTLGVSLISEYRLSDDPRARVSLVASMAEKLLTRLLAH